MAFGCSRTRKPHFFSPPPPLASPSPCYVVYDPLLTQQLHASQHRSWLVELRARGSPRVFPTLFKPDGTLALSVGEGGAVKKKNYDK